MCRGTRCYSGIYCVPAGTDLWLAFQEAVMYASASHQLFLFVGLWT
jgi:hypothetical protein